jgi:hypothetical protein
MGQFKPVENYEMSGSQSDHSRAYASLEAARGVHEIVDTHFKWLLKSGGTLAEVEDVAECLSREIGYAMLKASGEITRVDTRRGISAYIKTNDKMGNS